MAEDFANLRSLVIPTLVADNLVEQERLRRCNLLVHRGGKYAPGFVAEIPAMATATCTEGADMEALQGALESLLVAWGTPGNVDLSTVQ